MIFKAKNKSGQWVYSDPIQHQFAWYCETYGFDMSRFDFFLDDPENKLDERSCNTLLAKRTLAFEAYQQKNYDLLKERLDYLLLAVRAINQGRRSNHLSELMKDGYIKTKPQTEASQLITDSTTYIHKIKTRTQILDAEIKKAKETALDENDSSSVWTELLKMAKTQQGCLLGADEKDIKYQDGEEVKFFSKKNLSDRMARANPR